MRNSQRTLSLLAASISLLVFASYSASYAKEKIFVLPRAFHAKTYPANDIHNDEKVTIAADPYDTADKASTVFTVNYRENGLLPIHLIISNDGNQPVSLAQMKVVFITKSGAKMDPARPEDIYRRISRQKQGQQPSVNPLPFPRKRSNSVSHDAAAEVQGSQFQARAVEAHATQAGFFFFDVSGIDNPLAGGRLEVTGIRNSDGEEIFYFEIPMEKYLSYQPLK
jgi:hypothetical protein